MKLVSSSMTCILIAAALGAASPARAAVTSTYEWNAQPGTPGSGKTH
jgi:hypothetical protein